MNYPWGSAWYIPLISSFNYATPYYLLQVQITLYVSLESVLVLLKIVVVLGAMQSYWK